MRIKKEKVISVYNKDVAKTGRYIYTDIRRLSARLATKRQTDEIVNTILLKIGRNKKILDVGCGDGTFTLELLKKVSPKKIVGFDNSKMGIKFAQEKVKKGKLRKIKFFQASIYDIDKKIKKGEFDVAIIRGVLHHLYEPKKAIESVTKVVDKVVVLECNGYNPILKVIEKVSPYHIEHEEKSYFPPLINKWFKKNGFFVKKQNYCVIIPYFCNKKFAQFLQTVQPFFERLPFVSMFYCGDVLLYYEKNQLKKTGNLKTKF